jgi:hypothetical protein
MRYTVRKSIVEVVGELWMPSTNAATTITMSEYDIENARDDEGKLTRESLENWLGMHTGDFSRVIDFHASIEDGDTTVDIPWGSEEGEFAYYDCFPSED